MTNISATRKAMKTLLVALCASMALTACASSQSNPTGVGIADPMEGTNRAVFAFNDAMDDAIIHPMLKGYRYVVPKPARTGLHNVLRNLKSPVTMANQLLQGDLDGAGDVFVRAVVNSLLGIGGIFDVAGYEGIEYEAEDFGQTLAVWGVGHGPYMVVPLFGPASLRDGTGFIVDSLADPLRYYMHNIDEEEWYYVKVGLDYIDLRDGLMDILEDLESSSFDYYAAVRSTYVQRREALVNDENPDTGGSTLPSAAEF